MRVNAIRRLGSVLVSCCMAVVGMLFAAMVAGLASLLLSDEGPSEFGQIVALLSVLGFLSLLAYICFLFAYRLARGRKYSDGTYLPPWTFGVMGGVMLVAQLMAGITANEWKLLLKGWPVTLMMFAVPVAAYYRNRRKKNGGAAEY